MKTKQICITRNHKKVYVDVTEEQYNAYMRPTWAEQRKEKRHKRCSREGDNICMFDCTKCKGKQFDAISFEEHEELVAFDNVGTSVEELAEHEMRKQFLHDYLDALDQQTQAILKLYNSGYSQQEVADQFGIKRDTVGNLVKKHLRILKKLAVEKNLK
jgi:RNA polymerase sigma factor (sigma-70 family)